MTDYTFQVDLYRRVPGGRIVLARNGSARITQTVGGLPAPDLKQGGQPVAQVQADANGRLVFTSSAFDITITETATGYARRLVSPDAQAEAIASGPSIAFDEDGRPYFNAAGIPAAGNQDAAVAAQVQSGEQTKAALDAWLGASGVGGKVDKSSLVVNVSDYGAALDGATNDAVAFQAAIAQAASTGRPGVVTWAGRAAVTGITLPAGVVLRGHGTGSVLVQASGAGPALIGATGSLGSPVLLTADAAENATTLTIASTTGLAAGDTLILSDTTSYNPLDATYKSGEQVIVKSVDSGTQVTLTTRVRGSWATPSHAYTVANGARVRKAAFVRGIGVEDCAIEGDPSSATVLGQFTYCDGVSVRNVRVRSGGTAAWVFTTTRDFTVSGGSIRNLTDNLAGGQVGYAVAASGASEGGAITGVTISKVRHGFTTMADDTGMPHSVTVSGCVITDGITAAGLDTHAAGEDIHFTGNTIVGGGGAGIAIRSRHTSATGNRIRGCAGSGIQCTETLAADIDIVGNVVRNVGERGFVTGAAVAGLRIKGNIFDRMGLEGVRVTADSTGVRIEDNDVTNVGLTTAGRNHIQSLTGVAGQSKTGWVIARNLCGNEAGVGSASGAVVTAGSLTGSFVIDNRAFGTFSGTVFDTTTNTARRNEQIDQPLRTVTGSRGGNAALASLITQLAALGVISDSTTA